jgi:hypothetical protein
MPNRSVQMTFFQGRAGLRLRTLRPGKIQTFYETDFASRDDVGVLIQLHLYCVS